MNPQQQLFAAAGAAEDTAAPVVTADEAAAPATMPAAAGKASAPAALRATPAPDAIAAGQARELWVAVQSDDWQSALEAGQLMPAHPAAQRDAMHGGPAPVPAALAGLVQRAQGFTPRVAVESSDALLLELAGSVRLFGGLPALLQALRAAFPRPLRLALAPTPLAAVLLARAGCNCCILSTARLKGRLAALPLAHLRWPEEELSRLASMGVRTLAELLRLPRAGLARRIGPERLWQLDRLTGARTDPRAALAQRETFHERIDPDHETFDHERLLAALQPALERLEIFLRERQRGVTALRLRLHYRRAAPLACLVRCVVPEYRAARFTALLAARLESLQLAEPVRRMELIAGRARRFVAASAPLWAAGEQGGAPAAAEAPEFLQMLLARLGDQAVYSLAEIDEHRPERQQQRVWPAIIQADAPRRPAARDAAFCAMPEGATRPLGLLGQPQPLEMRRDAAGRVQGLRHAGQELALLSGPERIQTGWWDGGAIARDYYVARATDGARWWIFRECDPPRRWFVHGCFA